MGHPASMKEVFNHATETRLCLQIVRPTLSIGNADETEEDKFKGLRERVKPLSAAYNALLSANQKNAPFYDKELFRHFDECANAANAELVQVMTAGQDSFGLKWYEQGLKNQERMDKAYFAASEFIRNRIATLAVLPST